MLSDILRQVAKHDGWIAVRAPKDPIDNGGVELVVFGKFNGMSAQREILLTGGLCSDPEHAMSVVLHDVQEFQKCYQRRADAGEIF